MELEDKLTKFQYLDRDISWLSFNGKVLDEAANSNTPLLERIKFMSIFSSNLDEFYRVRIPALNALKKVGKNTKNNSNDILSKASDIVNRQQSYFGNILREQILPSLEKENVILLYNAIIPDSLLDSASRYFFNKLLAYLKYTEVLENCDFFPENNKLYFIAKYSSEKKHGHILINIPSDKTNRFTCLSEKGIHYILFIDDLIKCFIKNLFPDTDIKSIHSFKITRDAVLEFDDDYTGDLAKKMERKLAKRDYGIATRLLYDEAMPDEVFQHLIHSLNLSNAIKVKGGSYHNLKDLAQFPYKKPSLEYPDWPSNKLNKYGGLLLDNIRRKDLLINPPYDSYETVLRFFNEAAIHPDVESLYVTLYRVATDSIIANSLISAAANGKKVTVIIELKARFDENNNIKWTKRFREAGIKIVHSRPSLKVHAKCSLIKFKRRCNQKPLALLATGNLNEDTARFYTDHILLTSNTRLTKELDSVFKLLRKQRQETHNSFSGFKELLVAKSNLLESFIALIDNEIEFAKSGFAASITVKLNNLEEKTLIDKLYEASLAGVRITLIVRGICALVPGIDDLSQNIKVIRIVGRYLEHGRIFVFGNNGNPKVYLGSADWMRRNIHRRIEICFPIYDPEIKSRLLHLVSLQSNATNSIEQHPQEAIYNYLK
ncbi:polyphosphate kinase 1 [Flavobacterium sp.]|uniref:polyphosphate kinase 1 n=1 Tax=Flavobacterium sp. TaxID=239 RepID=UPI0039E3CED8